MSVQMLSDTIDMIAKPGKGILAADESLGTIGKRFQSIDIDNTEENRRRYRSLLATTENLASAISGIILFEETLQQSTESNTPIPLVLKDAGIAVGIKVDKGLIPFTNFPEEKITQGLDGLEERLLQYQKLGATFAKWRDVFVISSQKPSRTVIDSNAELLARYAAICQSVGMVPIVEPEVLMDGNHSLQRCAEVTESVLKSVFQALARHQVKLEYTLLKPNMVLPGKDSDDQASPDAIAEVTFEVLQRAVPKAIPSIHFLSGGQTPEQATLHLNLMNQLGEKPWILSFSYGRALQAPCLEAWQGKEENVATAQQALYHRSHLNSKAMLGEYRENLEVNHQ